MNVGTYKGKIISDLIESKKPQTMLEIGGYVGYSAILFGKALRDAGGKRYMSLEQNAEFASIARSLVALAGLDDIVTIVEGPCRKTLRQLSQNPEYAAPWDIIFLDHTKLAYLDDLKLCEKLELVAPGTVVLADDMIQPGNPAYSSYVRAPTSVKRHSISSLGEDGTESNDGAFGNPDLVYETQMLEGLQPSGLQVSTPGNASILQEEYLFYFRTLSRFRTVCGWKPSHHVAYYSTI